MKRVCLLGVLLCGALPLLAQYKVTEPDKQEGGVKRTEIPANVKTMRVDKVEPVLDPSTVVSFKDARLTDMKGNQAKIDLKDKVTIVEYWSRKSNQENLYWNRMRDLEHKYANNNVVQIISVNYDTALGGAGQRQAVAEYLKTHTAPKKVLLDVDDAIRELFSIPGPLGYMVFNHREQFIYCGRGDDPTAEELFKKIDEAIASKQKWDDYVQRTLGQVVVPKKK